MTLLMLLVACAQADDTYMGRRIAATMSHHGAPWLMRSSRDSEEDPTALLEMLRTTLDALRPAAVKVGMLDHHHVLLSH